MNILIDYFSSEEVSELLLENPEIAELTDEEVMPLIEILKEYDCSSKTIKEVIYTNPSYLNRELLDIKKLILCLINLNIVNFNTLFYDNPWLLNRDAFEIKEFIKKGVKKDFDLESIVDLIQRNPDF